MKGSCLINKCFYSVLLSSLFIFLSGCTITREATLTDAQIKGAVNLPPLHLAEKTEAGNVKISSRINYTPVGTIRDNVKPDAYINKQAGSGKSSDSDLKLSKTANAQQAIYGKESNLEWEIPEVNGGVDLEIFVWSSFALTGSLNFASGGASGSVGFALQSVPNELGVRLDAGLLFNHFSYNVYATVEEREESIFGSSSQTYYFHDIGSSRSTNFYINLTFNSVSRQNLFGGALSLGYFRQTVLDYNPLNLDDGSYILIPLPVVINNDTRLEATAGYFNIFPAVFFNITENVRLITGGRVLIEMEMGDGDVNFWPSVQMEFAL